MFDRGVNLFRKALWTLAIRRAKKKNPFSYEVLKLEKVGVYYGWITKPQRTVKWKRDKKTGKVMIVERKPI